MGRLFRNIHLSLQYSSRSRIHASLYDICTSCTMPLPLGHSVQALYSCFISNTLLLLLHRFRVAQATATVFRSLLLKSTSRSAHEIMYLSTTHVRLLPDVTDFVKMAVLTAVFPLTDFPTSIFLNKVDHMSVAVSVFYIQFLLIGPVMLLCLVSPLSGSFAWGPL